MVSAGQQIGGYTVLRQLGKGGMGEVYLAQHRRVARRAAIKVLVPELSQNEVMLERFFNEARAASLIRHPGIVEILDCDLYLGQAYIVMEYLEGESFGGYLFRTGPLDADMPFFYGVSAAVASAVGAAHSTEIIHRDLKPDNIFLHLPSLTDAAVTVKILDFGIAKLAQQGGAPSQTGTGVLLGTPAYMSPEQCRGAGRVDSRSDIYSLGCILYEALTGGPPFVRDGFGDLIIAHVAEAPEPLSPRIPGVARQLDSLILRMLAKAPDDRPQTMEEVVQELRACASAEQVTLDVPLRGKIRVERPPERLDSAITEPAIAAGSSGIDTTPLGPTPRGQRAVGTPADFSGGVPRAQPEGASSQRSRRMTPDPASSAPLVAGFAPGSTRILTDTAGQGFKSTRPTTTLSSTAAEAIARPKPRRMGLLAAVGGGAVLAIGGAVAIIGTRSAAPREQAAPAVNAPAPETQPPPAVAPAAPIPTQAAKPADDQKPKTVVDTVRIDFQGAPPETTVEVDGKAARLPLDLPRGAEIHRVTLHPPGAPPRTIEIDGTRNRIVDMVVAASGASSAGGKREAGGTTASSEGHTARERSSDRESPRHSGSGARERGRTSDRERGAGEKKTPAGNADREAITDI